MRAFEPLSTLAEIFNWGRSHEKLVVCGMVIAYVHPPFGCPYPVIRGSRNDAKVRYSRANEDSYYLGDNTLGILNGKRSRVSNKGYSQFR
jgi:hypothetical protein